MSDALFSDLLTDFGDMLPDNHNLPSSTYDAKKTLSCLSLSHEKIHACSNDCILYRKQYKDCVSCPKCGLSRWNLTKKNIEKKGVPAKPGNDIDVYLDVLVEDLNDCGKELMVSMILIENICGENTYSKHLENGRKMSFFGHRRFLPRFHPYRRQTKEFNGVEEHGETPTPLSGVTLYDKILNIKCEFGKKISVKGKTKDNVAARLDMLQMGVRPELKPKFEGYSSNMKNLVCMSELKLSGLKYHDCHVLMQHFLPILIRDVLPKYVRYAIIRLCFFFKDICSKVIDVAKLDKLQSDLVVTLCLLEQYFPPSFFDVMVHLTVHLVREVRLCGPVFFRWMYPFERCMKVFKSYVGSRKHPEGCIVQRYSAEEAIEFCSEYLNGIDPVGIPQSIRDPN
ncbi:uncharacterized protein [Henckelia pumila]|uniref:uncharacterized protein n=1 Tax=Henckelia pumila TaxID=405737 RepID=UPI003C6DF5A0